MKTATRKMASLAFILLGFTPMLFVLVMTLKKQDVRKLMKQALEYRALQTITLPENEVVWMDKHEIWVNESMFDIHTKELAGGIYTFTGLYDGEETLLVEQERNAAGKNAEQNKLLAQLFKSLPVCWYAQSDRFELLPAPAPYHLYVPENAIDPFREIITPPPQV